MSKFLCSECQKELFSPLVCMECQYLQKQFDENYFVILGITQKYQIDIEQLDENYEELTAFLHPDLYANQSTKVQNLSRQYSILLNQAYKVIKDPLERAIYLLNLKFGKPLSDSVLPQNFLMDMFSLQEKLSTADLTESEKESFKTDIQQKVLKQQEERIKLFDLEPSPEVFDLLQQNINVTRYLIRFFDHNQS